MESEMRKDIDRVKNFGKFINEDTNKNRFDKQYQEYLKRQQTKVEKIDEYTDMTNYVKKFDMIPYEPYINAPQGVYTLKNHTAPVDLRKCEMNDIAILKQAFLQLSEKCDEFISDRRDGNF
jgi:hypothetical protein